MMSCHCLSIILLSVCMFGWSKTRFEDPHSVRTPLRGKES